MNHLKSITKILILLIGILILTACGGLRAGPDIAQKYHEQGVLEMKAAAGKPNYEKAMEYFNQAIKAEPSFAKSYNARGVTYVLLGEFDKARADFEKALEVNPADNQAQENLKHIDEGEFEKATAFDN